MEEAYSKVFEKNTIEEGILDRAKGTFSGIGKAASKISDIAKSDSLSDAGKGLKTAFESGRSSSMVKTHVNKINNAIDDFINDLKKVGKPTENSIVNYNQVADFLKGIIKHTAKVSGRGQVSVTDLKSALDRAGFLAEDEPADYAPYESQAEKNFKDRTIPGTDRKLSGDSYNPKMGKKSVI